MKYREIMEQLRSLSNPEAVEGMARFGINPRNTFGVLRARQWKEQYYRR
jgi:hypothetical protein